ncbi:MAG: hypothetical protein IJD46_02355 [Bacilli bacterium]|nr:hypothetical protein [Bacilli bacterium]
MSLFSIVGCSNLDNSSQQDSLAETILSTEEISESTDNIIVNATYIEIQFNDEDHEGDYNIVDTYKELVELIGNDIPKKYSSTFFEENSLVLFKIIESSAGNKSIIESFFIEGNTISIDVNTISYCDVCVMGEWLFLLEVSKEEILNVESVEIIKNNQSIEVNNILTLVDIYLSIRKAYVDEINSHGFVTITIEDVKVLHYLGMFGDCYAALIKGDCMQIDPYEIQIGGILFKYDREVISIYNDGKYYNLKEAYDLKLITKQQLLDIYIEYQEYIHK